MRVWPCWLRVLGVKGPTLAGAWANAEVHSLAFGPGVLPDCWS